MRRPLLAAAIAFVVIGCSFTDLDGFTRPQAALDAAPAPIVDAARPETGTPPAEGGAPPTSTDPYGDEVRKDVPAAWYRFEETAGTEAKDELGLHPGVLPTDRPVVLGAEGVSGRAVKMNGQGIEVGDAFDFAGLSEFAVEAWGENDEQPNRYESLVAKRYEPTGDPKDGWILYFERTERRATFQFWKNGNVPRSAASSSLADGWHHIVVVAARTGDALSLTLYSDGVASPIDSSTVLTPDTPAYVYLGSGWNGRLDEVAIYDHALTAERISAHYAAVPR